MSEKKAYLKGIAPSETLKGKVQLLLGPYVRRGVVRIVDNTEPNKVTVEFFDKNKLHYQRSVKQSLKRYGYKVSVNRKSLSSDVHRGERGHIHNWREIKGLNHRIIRLEVAEPNPPIGADPFPPVRPISDDESFGDES